MSLECGGRTNYRDRDLINANSQVGLFNSRKKLQHFNTEPYKVIGLFLAGGQELRPR